LARSGSTQPERARDTDREARAAFEASRHAAVEVEWIEEIEQVAALEKEWRDIESRVEDRLAFGSFDYLYPWYRHMPASQGTPLVGVARRGGVIVGLAPLARRAATLGRVPVRRIDSAGHDGDVGELLFSSEEAPAFAELLESLFQRGGVDVAVFTGVAPGTWKHEALLRASEHAGRKQRDIAYQYATVDLDQGYAVYAQGLSAKLRGNFRRRRKRADAAGGVTLDRISRRVDRVTLSRYMERMFGIYERSWKAEGQEPIQDYHRRFYTDVAERFNQREMLDLSILQVGGRDASFILGIREGDTFHDVTISYDEAFASISPGTLLIQDLAMRLAEEGTRLVISHGDREYKRYWASRWVPQVRSALFAPGVRAGLARFARFEYPRIAQQAKGLLKGAGEQQAEPA
jgi:CelD/BcsL family acetyltransferase involved in cellulose biosynthesis